MKANKIGISINVKLINGSLKALKNALEEAKAAGFNAVELPIHGLDVIIGGKINDKRLKEIRNILKSYQFTYTVHCPESLNLMNIEKIETEKAILKSTIEFSYEIGAHILVYHPGRYKSEVEILLRNKKKLNKIEKDKLRRSERNILKGFCSTLRKTNVVLCMENARPFMAEKEYTYAESIEALVEQVRKIDDRNIGVNLDLGHAYLSTNFYNKDFLKTIMKIKPYLRHLHFHDNCGYPCYFQEKDQNFLIASGRGDMHMPLGWGNIPFKKAVKTLNPTGCFFVIELRSRYFEYIKECKQFLENLMADK